MKIVIATDAWKPQVNGVVQTLQQMTAAARRDWGAHIDFVTPQGFSTLPLPTYPDIRVALATAADVGRRIEQMGAEHVHIATEGPIGWAARSYCLSRGRPFTTGYHTRFPEYIYARIGLPEDWSYAALRAFHAPSGRVMAPTPSVRDDLSRRGFERVVVWSRGVDHTLYRPQEGGAIDLPRPIFLYVGRVAVEKNLEAMLSLDLPGSKVVVGDGPARAGLQRQFPNAHFLGSRFGEELARAYASADVFVFPSRTDTFGIVLIEAMGCGLPVAAFPVTGPLDVVGDSGAGVLSEDLRQACLQALEIPRAAAHAHALKFTWKESARQFLAHIADYRTQRIAAE
jgi:glycosyltransferase involved in cell wall biosynthesis